ncbi:hypothetical protein ACQY0O_007606 [Thecaphora frezii]
MESILRKELKQWQRNFRTKHGRDPTKRDILGDAEIASTYEAWNAIAAATGSKPKPTASSSRSDAVASSSRSSASAARKDEAQRRREEAPAPDPKRRRDDVARARPSSDQPTVSLADSNVFKTPTKPRRSSSGRSHGPVTPTHSNPFRTPTRLRGSSPSAAHRSPLGRHGPESSAERRPPPSPAGSVVDLQMTPTKPTTPSPSKLGSDRYDYAASPSKLRTLVASHSTRSPSGKRPSASDAAELVTYTPRTKARKRLRGEEVPPTPKQDDGRAAQRGSGAAFAAYLASASGDKDPGSAGEASVGKERLLSSGKRPSGGLAAYGFGPLGKPAATKRSAFGSAQKSQNLGTTLGVQRQTPLEQRTGLANGVSGAARAVVDDDSTEDEGGDDDPLTSSPSKGVRGLSERRPKDPRTINGDRTPLRPLSRSASMGSRSFQPLFASPCGNRAPSKLPIGGHAAPQPGSMGGGLFAAELAARKRRDEAANRSPARGRHTSSDNEEQDKPPSSSAPHASRLLGPSSLATGITSPSSAGNATDGRRLRRRPSWKISTIVLSDDEEDEGAGGSDGEQGRTRTAKTITVLPYQRYGSLRDKVPSLKEAALHDSAARPDGAKNGDTDMKENSNDDDDDDDDVEGGDDLFGYTLHRSPRKAATLALADDAPAGSDHDRESSSDSEACDAAHHLLLSSLSLDSPRRRGAGARSSVRLPLQAQGQGRIRAQRLDDAKHLAELLGAGGDEMEVLRVEDEMRAEVTHGATAATGTAAKTWGEAKSRAKPEAAKAKGRVKAKKDEATQQVQPIVQVPAKPKMAFSRAGRSGLGADEDEQELERADRVLWKHFASDKDDGVDGFDDDDDLGALGSGAAGGASRRQRRGAASDDDWASEVDSDEYGLGDGRMDELNVI